jgi:formylglycine-generating enzyme required for sulfatase activity
MNPPSLSNLVVQWSEAFERGENLTPEQLCPDNPDLAMQLAWRIDLLRSMRESPNRANGPMPAERETLPPLPPLSPLAPTGSPRTSAPHPEAMTPSSPSASAPAPVCLPGYEIERELGRGGMGVVYLARQVELGRLVALKMLRTGPWTNSEERERLLREARLVARLDHPGIVAIHAIGEHQGQPFLALEHVPGGSLAKRLDGKPWPIAQAVALVEQLARAVHHAHLHGIVHRDIKPANVLLTTEGAPRVADFGLARHAEDSGGTRSGTVMGTPRYMAPEQATGKVRAIGPQTDIHALGVILYELLTGRSPFSGSKLMAILQSVRDRAPAPPRRLRPELSRELEAVCLRCLAKDPAARYPDAETLANELKRLPASGPIRRADSRVRWRAVVASLLVVALGFGGFGVSQFFGRNGAEKVSEDVPILIDDDGKQTPELKVNLTGKSPILPGPDKAKAVKSWPREITNSIGMTLVRIPLGTFLMGSPKGERPRANDEEQHEVEIRQEFWLGIHEVTQKQFKQVMGYNPSFFSKDGEGKPGATYSAVSKPAGGKDKVPADTGAFPVENVSWEEADEFCKKLSAREVERNSGRKYRLPTEAEWEYACRGGSPVYRVFHFGNFLLSTPANIAGRGDLKRTCKVGSYAKNGFGLYDMHGNVSEWCQDWYAENYYAKSPRKDPPGPSEGSDRVLRGGAWVNKDRECRSASRLRNTPAFRDSDLGFRVALVPAHR